LLRLPTEQPGSIKSKVGTFLWVSPFEALLFGAKGFTEKLIELENLYSKKQDRSIRIGKKRFKERKDNYTRYWGRFLQSKSITFLPKPSISPECRRKKSCNLDVLSMLQVV
jgi:hypothetical protein